MDATDAARALVDIDGPNCRVTALTADEAHAGLHDGEQEDIEQDDEDDAPREQDQSIMSCS